MTAGCPARRVDSPNFDARPTGEAVSLIVVHAISLPPRQFGGDAIERLFTNTLDPDAHAYFANHRCLARLGAFPHPPRRRVAAVRQLRAARLACRRVRVERPSALQRFFVGHGFEGCDDLPFEELQYLRLGELIAELCAHYPIAALAGYSDIAPGRKTDPGPFFGGGSAGARSFKQKRSHSWQRVRKAKPERRTRRRQKRS